METFLYITVSIFVISLFFIYICHKSGESKLYCRFFDKDEWFGWKKVIKNFDSVRYIEYYKDKFHPLLNHHKFNLIVDGKECHINYWDVTDNIGVHDLPGVKNGLLCDFDKYHSNLVKYMLIEKFKLE